MVFRSCKTFNQCYECAKLGNGVLKGTGDRCEGEYTKYRFKLQSNSDTGEKSIACTNKRNTCERHICECDRKLAENLQKWEMIWHENYHTGLGDGTWKYDEQCKKKPKSMLYTAPETCCGDNFPDMKPKQGGKECCAETPWDPNVSTKKCCLDGHLKNTC